MRRYDVVSGTIFILSIVNSAFAAPVLVQEKRQASADVVHIPKDLISVLGKRGGKGINELLEEYLNSNSMGKLFETSDAHASSSSLAAPLGSDHGPTNVVQTPAPNPALSTTNPDPYHPLMESSGPSSTAPMQGDHWLESLDAPLPLTPTWVGPEYGSGYELTAAHAPQPDYSNPEKNAFFKWWKPYIIESSEIPPPSNSAPSMPNPHLPEELFKTWKPPILESSDVHASSSPAPSPASPSANPDPLDTVESSGPSAATQVQGDGELNGPPHTQALAEAESHFNWEQEISKNLEDPKPHDSDSDFDWEQEISTILEDPKPPDQRRRRD